MKTYIIIVLLVVVAAASAAPPALAMEDRSLGAVLGKIVEEGHNLNALRIRNKADKMKIALKNVFEFTDDGHWGK